MNGICGMTSLLLETPLDEEQREYAETVRTCSNDLLTLINDILDFATIAAGQFALNIVTFALRTVIDDVFVALQEAAAKKGLAMTALIHEEVPQQVTGDPGRLRQVLMILVGNAVKFTEQGTVTVSITRAMSHPGEMVLHFTITDTGIGIPSEAQEKLFQVFSQVDGSLTRKYGGTGLGLAIARRLVTIMEGDIGMESTFGQGSTFWFTVHFAAGATVSTLVPTHPPYA
jgi:signal transduction histidine kinase